MTHDASPGKFDHKAWTDKELESLHDLLCEENLKSLEEAIKFYRTAKSVGRFNVWLIAGIAGLIITFSAFGEAVRKMFGWMGKS